MTCRRYRRNLQRCSCDWLLWAALGCFDSAGSYGESLERAGVAEPTTLLEREASGTWEGRQSAVKDL